MRPAYLWETVARSLDRAGAHRPDGGRWTGPALARAVRRLVRDGFVDGNVLERTPRRRDSDDLVTLVAMAVRTLKPPTLANIARHLGTVNGMGDQAAIGRLDTGSASALKI